MLETPKNKIEWTFGIILTSFMKVGTKWFGLVCFGLYDTSRQVDA